MDALVSSSNWFLWFEGTPVQAHDPTATTFFELARIFSSSSRSRLLAIAPSTNATSMSSMTLVLWSTRACLKSISFFQVSQLSFNSSVNMIVLSSQQLNENQPTFSFFMVCCNSVKYVFSHTRGDPLIPSRVRQKYFTELPI